MTALEPIREFGDEDSAMTMGLMKRIAIFVLLLICALSIFLLGSNYVKLFPTNGNSTYAGVLAIIFLIAALLMKRSIKFAAYWQLAYAFSIASIVNLVSALFATGSAAFVQSLGIAGSIGSNQFQAMDKLREVLLVVIPIIVLVRVSGADLGSVLIKRGNTKWWLGIGALVFANFFTSVLLFFALGYSSLAALGSATVWGLLFALSNGFSEELWFRSLFIKKMVPLLGVGGAVLITSIWFAMLHMLASYLQPEVVPIMLINTFTLGFACGYLMVKTDSIWGAVLIHAAADLFLFIAMLAVK